MSKYPRSSPLVQRRKRVADEAERALLRALQDAIRALTDLMVEKRT